MQNMDWKNKALTPNSCDPNPPSNNCNPTWDVNLRYIDKNDLNALYGYVPNPDEVANGMELTDLTEVAISYASEKINIIAGNKIEGVGFNNLNATQQNLVKRATARMTIWYLKNGIAFLTSSVSSNVGGISTSITPPTEPDYVLNDVYGLLEQANLYQPVKSFSSDFCSDKYNQGSINWGGSIYDQGDIQYLTWNQANKAFLRPSGIISSGSSISHQDVTDIQAKVDLNAIHGEGHEIKIETNNVFVPNPNKLYTIASGDNTTITGTETGTENRFLVNSQAGSNVVYNEGLELTGNNLNVLLDPATMQFVPVQTSQGIRNAVSSKNADLTLYQTKTDNNLITTDKTVVGAINDLSAEDANLETKIFANTNAINLKQDVNAPLLNTMTKNIVGAINEVDNNVNNLTFTVDNKQNRLDNGVFTIISGNQVDVDNVPLGTQINTVQSNYGLATTAQTIKGAIAELNATKQNQLTAGTGIEITGNVISATGADLSNYYNKSETDTKLNLKQDISDPTLSTNAKQIVPAINEIYQEVFGGNPVGSSTNARNWTYTLVEGARYEVGYNWNVGDTQTEILVSFTWHGTASVIADNVKDVVLLGIGLVKLNLNATATGITITAIGNATGGNIISLKEIF